MYQLHLHKITPPSVCSVPSLLKLLLGTCEDRSPRRYKTQARILKGRREAAELLIAGLVQIARASSWHFVRPERPTIALCLPLSPHGYAKGDFVHLSFTAVTEVIGALEALGLIELRAGYLAGEHCFQSQIWPTDRFQEQYATPLRWEPRKVSKADPIVLKNYDAATKKKYPVLFTDTPEIRRMRKNLRRINQALLDSAIALAVDEFQLWWIRHQMAKSELWSDFRQGSRMLSFESVELRRVFARNSFKLGGRLYGGWWQSIQSRYRPYITINGQVTVECDFSTLHPLLMYADSGVEPPEGDFYDLGYEGPDKPRARGIFKQAFNALINDGSGLYQIPKEDQIFLGMTNAEVKNAIIKRHPLVRNVLGKGKGLKYQWIDSQIAEKVMLSLLDQGIVALPIHDSFIVIADYEANLRAAMAEAFEEIIGGVARLKDVEIGKTCFDPVHLPSGELDLTYLRNLEATSPYHVYHQTYFASRAPQRGGPYTYTIKRTKC